MGLQLGRVQVQGFYHPSLTAVAAIRNPRFEAFAGFFFRQPNRFHHLSDDPVAEQNNRSTIALRHIERFIRKVSRFLSGRRRKDGHPIVAVPPTPGGLEVVALRRLNSTQARSAPHYVDDHARQLGRCQEGNPLLLQTDSGAGRGGHHRAPCACRPIDHVHGRQFTLRLKKSAAYLGQTPGEVFHKFGLRSNGITEIITASGAHRRLG